MPPPMAKISGHKFNCVLCGDSEPILHSYEQTSKATEGLGVLNMINEALWESCSRKATWVWTSSTGVALNGF